MVARSVIDALSVFRFLTLEEREALAAVGEIRAYPKGTQLFHAGDPRQTFFVLLDGDVRITSSFYGRGETVVIYHAGDFISLLSIFPQSLAHTNGAEALSNTASCLEFRFPELATTCENHPALLGHLLAAAAVLIEDRLWKANRKLFTFFSISRILRSAPSFAAAAPEILDVARAATTASRGLLLLFEPMTRVLFVAAAAGYENPAAITRYEGQFERDSLVGAVLAHGSLTVIRERKQSWAGIPYATGSMIITPLLAASGPLAVSNPLVRGEGLLGVLVLADRAGNRPFLANSVLLVEAMSQQFVDAAERGRLTLEQEQSRHLRRVYVGPYASKL